jgi:hypothetical protein
MIGNFSENSLQLFQELVSEGLPEEEVFDFARCVRPDGTAYGSRGKCRKGTEEEKAEQKPIEKKRKKKEKAEPRGLFTKGKDVDIFEVEKKAEEWRKEAGLKAFPGTIDWKHDRVHALTHEFLGGTNKISEWIGHGKTPTPAEETLVNMVHRAAALKARGDDPRKLLDDSTLDNYFRRDINFMSGRGNIPDDVQKLYFDEKGEPDVKKFIKKYREMEATSNFDKLLDAAHTSFSNAGDYVFKESMTTGRKKVEQFLKDPIVKEAMRTDGPEEVARLASMAGVLERDASLLQLAGKLSKEQ